jgi:DDE domain
LLHHYFGLCLCEVELILAAQGVVVSCETIQEWSLRFERAYSKMLKRCRLQPGDAWFLDEVLVGIQGKRRYIWRAVDRHGDVLDVLVQSRRNKGHQALLTKAAEGFALRGHQFKGSASRCAHVPAQRGPCVAPVDDEIVTLGLSSDSVHNGPSKRDIATGRSHGRAQIRGVLLA